MRRIIAIDPGEMTGWAIGRIGDDAFVIDTYGYSPWKQFCMNYMSVMDGDDPFEIVVYESWRLRKSSAMALIGSDMPSSQCIGIIKYGGWKHGAHMHTSEPAFKDVIDKQMGGTDYLPVRDTVEHYRDAVRHFYWYAINKGGIAVDYARAVAGNPQAAVG